MSDQKHVLFSTDLSDESLDSIPTIVEMVNLMNARLTVLYVLPSNVHHAIGSPFVSPIPLPTDEEFLDNARQRLEQMKPRFEGCETALEVRLGEDVPETILDFAKERGADVLAMSTHARTGLSRLVVGSIAETLIRHATIPCLVIPQRDD